MSERTITIDGNDYRYRIGRAFLKVHGFPAIDFSALTGMPWHEIERGIHKRWFRVTPKHVREFILSRPAA